MTMLNKDYAIKADQITERHFQFMDAVDWEKCEAAGIANKVRYFDMRIQDHLTAAEENNSCVDVDRAEMAADMLHDMYERHITKADGDSNAKP